MTNFFVIKATVHASTTGTKAKTVNINEEGIRYDNADFCFEYWIALSVKKMNPRTIIVGINEIDCSVNLKVRMYKLPPPANKQL